MTSRARTASSEPASLGRAPHDAAYTETRTRRVEASSAVLWEVVAGIGGDDGWYADELLWRTRAALDRLLGGPGMRGRRDDLRVGDPLDFWRVVLLEPRRRLQLRAEMRVPGTAWVEFGVHPLSRERSLLTQRTWFVPDGLVGHAFWWAELPGHRVIFHRLLSGMVRAAEARAR